MLCVCIVCVVCVYSDDVISLLYSNLVAMWEVLTGDVALMQTVLNHLIEVLELTLPYHEKTSTSASGAMTTRRVETPVPKNASAW